MSLTSAYTFVGKGNWSLDGVGGQATGGGVVSAIVPEGSQVEKALLYGTTYTGTSGAVSSATLSYGASSTTVTDWSALGVNSGLQAYRADITAFIDGVVDDGAASQFDFNLSDIVGSSVDGFALVVVYSQPTEDIRTIVLLDGFSASGGDSFALSFIDPVDTTQTGFEALMSVGIGFGYQATGGTGQFSNITVDGRQLTSSAGGEDDGVSTNGGLITIGGIGDDPANPDPAAAPGDFRIDDELYDLAQGNSADSAPFLANGATGLAVVTDNPSNNDNIFFAGFNITSVVSVDTDENDAPAAVADTATTAENSTVTTVNVLANDFDPDGDPLTLVSVDTAGLVGNLVNNGDGTFTYDPAGNFDALNGGDTATTSFKYTISDGLLESTATVTITINGVGEGGGEVDFGDCNPLPDNFAEFAILIEGTSGDDRIIAGTNEYNLINAYGGDDYVDGRGKRDHLLGGEGNDRLDGHNNADLLEGGEGNDFLNGGNGKDLLAGGLGSDMLMGGRGADCFFFAEDDLRPGDVDTILDFAYGQDHINFADITLDRLTVVQNGSAVEVMVDGAAVINVLDALASEVQSSIAFEM